MTRITTYHTEDGKPYKGQATVYQLFDGKGIGFDFFTLNGPKRRCKILNDSNEVIDRDTGEVIGEYDPMWKHAVLVLDEEDGTQ